MQQRDRRSIVFVDNRQTTPKENAVTEEQKLHSTEHDSQVEPTHNEESELTDEALDDVSAGQVSHSDIPIVKYTDKSSP
jgi:hypothetical protein